MSSYWRSAGMSYLQYLNVASQHVRNALKADLRAAAAQRSHVHVRHRVYENGALRSSKPYDSLEKSPLADLIAEAQKTA